MSALGYMVALFILASTQLYKNQLAPYMLFDTFIISAGVYLLYTIAAISGVFEFPVIGNHYILGTFWEFIVFMSSGALVQMLGSTEPTLLFDIAGFYITGILSVSILLLGQVVEWSISGVLDSLRGLNVAISFSLYKNHSVYTYAGIGFCFIMICAIKMLQKWRRYLPGTDESGPPPPVDEMQCLMVNGMQSPSVLVEMQGHDIQTAENMPEYSLPELPPTRDEVQGQDFLQTVVEVLEVGLV